MLGIIVLEDIVWVEELSSLCKIIYMSKEGNVPRASDLVWGRGWYQKKFHVFMRKVALQPKGGRGIN